MSVKLNLIEKTGYELLDKLDDERDVLTLDQYDGGTYICDAISEIADGAIPIYNHDVWEKASDISKYIEDAISEGVADVSDVDLIRIFQAGYYKYYTQSLYNNLDAMIFNMIVENVNTFLNDNSDDLIVDIDDIETEIDSRSQNYDNNKTMDSIFDNANEIIEMIKNGEFDSK